MPTGWYTCVVRPGRKMHNAVSIVCKVCAGRTTVKSIATLHNQYDRQATRPTEWQGRREGKAVTGRVILIRIPIWNRVATRRVGHLSRPNVDVYDGRLRSGIKCQEACVPVAEKGTTIYAFELADEKFWDLGG